MQFLLMQQIKNINFQLVSRLKDVYPDSEHIAVWKYAKENGYTLVSKDSDFNDICTLYDFPPHIIWLRLGNSRVSVAQDILVKYKDRICIIVQENKTGIIEIAN